ncbi:hypothetical protein FS749_003092 [Ceratobasidium sp. UAMH 11750]|nr:hypothetical protein FS749_003092 [Ceratobasidium sp. UAMH 11750]
MFYLRTSHMHNTPANVPKPTAPRSSLYAGCTRDEIVSILYPFGRESTATPAPPLPGLQRPGSRRNGLGGLVKTVSGLFRKGKTDKSKGTTSDNIKPLSSVAGLRPSGVMFDASEEFDNFGRRGTGGLGSGSELANVSGEVIDAHSDRDVSPGSFSSFGDILIKFLDAPNPSPVSTQHPVSSSIISDAFVIGGRLVSVDRSTGPRQDSIYDKAQSSTTPASFFESRPPSGEFNRMAVFKRASAVIQKRRIRPLRLVSKLRESMILGSDKVNPASVQAHSIQESPTSSLSPVPDLIVTNYDDSTAVVVKLDEDRESEDYVTPGCLYPDYVRERYPGAGQFADTPRLTLSTGGWNLSLQAVGEEDEEADDSSWSDDSESDPALASPSGSSSPGSSPPTTPTSADMPLISTTAACASPKPTSSKSWAVIDEDEVGDDAIGIAL